MDIIEFLTQDHENIRKELVSIHKNLSMRFLPGAVESFILRYHFHEMIEEELLFARLKPFEGIDEMLFHYEKEHTRVWDMLKELTASLETRDLALIQQSFFELHAFLEQHMLREEKKLFAEIKMWAAEDPQNRVILEDLGEEVKKRLEKFIASSAPAASQ